MEFNPVDYPERGTPIYEAPRRGLWTYWDLGVFVLFSFVAQIVCVIGAFVAVPAVIAAIGESPRVRYEAVKTGVLVVATVSSTALSMAYVYYVVAIKYRLRFWTALGFTPFRRRMCWFLLLGAVISVAEGLLGGLIGVPADTPFAELLKDRGTFWLMGSAAVFVAPFLEEILFRGFLYRPLERSWGPLGAIGVTGLIFGLLHGPQYGWSWQIILLLTLTGVLLGVARWKTGSLWPPILIHGASNLVSVAASGVQNSF